MGGRRKSGNACTFPYKRFQRNSQKPIAVAPALKNGLTVITNGSALRVGKGSWDVYFAGNKNFSEGDSPHTAWVGGSNGFRRGVSEKELDRLRPEAAVYGGGGRFVGEDKDVFISAIVP